MILHQSNYGLQNDIQETTEEILSKKSRFSVVATLMFLGIAIQYGDSAYSATNDKLDVNLNVAYVGTRSIKDSDAVSEMIFQFPFPLTEHSRDTGQGLFGGITYYDDKTFMRNINQLVSEIGLGRIYYSYSVPGDTPYTFVPFVTLMREFSYDDKNVGSAPAGVRDRSYFLPGMMYAYRFNEKVAFHFDTELYNASVTGNNRSRIGFTYSRAWPWIISASHERLSWNIDSSNIIVNGSSRVTNAKIIYRDPPMGNFSFIIGYGKDVRDTGGSLLLLPSSNISSGTYFGIEASAGVLAW